MKKQISVLLMGVALCVPRMFAAEAVLCGSVYNTADDSFVPGVYELPQTAAGTFKLVGATTDHKASGGGFCADNIYYVGELNNDKTYYGGLNFYLYSIETWELASPVYASTSPSACGMASGFAVTPTGTIYGCASDYNRNDFFLYSYEYKDSDFDYTKIGTVDHQVGALASDADGKIYGIDANGLLFSVSTTDATLSKVGDTGVKPLVDGEYIKFIHASSIIDSKGAMYLAIQGADLVSQLYTVDLATAKATKLADYPAGYVVSGLFMAEPAAEPGAPAAATELEASFTPGSLSGTISFKAPGTTYDGKEFTGNLNYKVLVNNEQKATGTVYSNVSRSVEITVPERGMYEFKVVMSNSVGDGPAAKISAAVGYAAPAAPKVSTSRYGSSVQVQWEAVTTTADGTPINGDVSYRVVRTPDNKVLEESTSWTSCWDYGLGDELCAYQYSVTAYCNGTPSEEGLSPFVVAGSAQTPYKETFDEPESMAFYTIIDANNDEYTWEYYYKEVRSKASDEVDADDWLISPPINMQSGKYYMISVDTRVYNPDFPGKFEMFVGDAPTAEAMTTLVIAPTEVTSESRTTHKGLVAAEGYGNKYIGLHSITEKGNWWLFATNLTVSAPYEGTVPAAATDFTARSASDGSSTVTISLKAPLTDVAGNNLSSLDKIEILRNGVLIHTIEPAVPGETYEYIDKDCSEGENAYTAVAHNYSGAGIEASCSGYSGINIPGTVTEVYAYCTDNPGEVRVEWKPVTKFIDGTPMDESLVTYNIYTNVTGQDMMILTELTGTSKTFQIMYPTEEEPQLFFQFGVTAQTAGGENTKGTYSDFVALGEAYTLPYEESFPDLRNRYLALQGGSDKYSYWDNASDKTFEEVQSQDGDNGMLAMFSQYKGSQAYFKTGLIDLTNAEKPMLTFYAFNLVDPTLPDNNTIEVQIGNYNEFTTVKTVTLEDFGTEAWHRVEVPLTDYVGKVIQVNLIGTVNSYSYIHIDNMKVMERQDNDIAVMAVSAPERVKAGNCANIMVDVANYGLKDATEVTLDLLLDGEKVDSKKFAEMKTDARLSHTFAALHSVAFPESVQYEVQLTWAPDDNTANNNSEPFNIITIYPNYPTVTDLVATYTADDNKNITLTWSTPDLNADFADDITEGFESVTPWTVKGLDGWTFVDADQMCIYGFRFFDVPAYGPAPDSKQSWFAMSDTFEPMAEHFSDPGFYKAHEGNNYLGSMAVTDGPDDYNQKRTDDWAISPLLYGGSQTISLWAKSMLADALEELDVLYSTSGTEISDFKPLLNVREVPWTWTQYFAELPAGTKYFAIRNHSRDAYVLMIDDVNFTPANSGESLEVSGYNVYRDGVRINDATVTTNTFADKLADSSTPEYTVTALYANRGESAFSNAATPELSGISDAATASIRIFATPGCINVTGAFAAAIEIYSIDGRHLSRSEATGHDTIAVAPGVYIVRVADKVSKLVVK